MDIKNIAWAAGIYEGEGCFASGNGLNNKYIHVTQKDKWLCYRLRELFGGTVKFYDTHYRWFLYGDHARGFLLTIFSFLSPRRKAAIMEHKEFFKQSKCRNGLHDYNSTTIGTEYLTYKGKVNYCIPCRRRKRITDSIRRRSK